MLGDLEFKLFGLQSAGAESAFDCRREVFLLELTRRDVDGYRALNAETLLQGSDLFAGLDEDPLAEENTPVLPESRPGSIHAPAIRKYGSEEDTAVTSEAAIAKMVQAAARPSMPPPGVPRAAAPTPAPLPIPRMDDESTSGVRAITPTGGEAFAAAPRTRAWPDEKPAAEWLDEAQRDALRERAAWLEEEARAR